MIVLSPSCYIFIISQLIETKRYELILSALLLKETKMMEGIGDF